MAKIKWKCAEVPTGRYRSFKRRSWPFGSIGESAAAQLVCADEYVPQDVRDGNHAPITVLIAFREIGTRAFKWRALKATAATLDEAKVLAQAFYDAHEEQAGLAEQRC